MPRVSRSLSMLQKTVSYNSKSIKAYQ